ncbi:MAG: T9SS type A sorting domain-containing protein, partial [Bacteroidia bacterium]
YRKNRQPKKDEWRQDVIMWFQPTEAFLAVLSDTLRTRIMQENPILSNTNLDTKKKPSQLKNIELSIYPNPVIDIATINYHLDKDKKVNIALHDISGKLVKVFVRNETRNAGKNSLEIDLKDLIQGVYILSIETADGNILTQRVIKQ